MMVVEPVRAPATAAPSGRVADRRRGATALLATVTSVLTIGREPRMVRERFECELAHLLKARAVVLRDDPSPPPAAATISVPVPSSSSDCRPRIDAIFDSVVTPDDWTYQLLEAAAHVATLVLEIERAHGLYGRLSRPRPDGVAPLIGSSHAIRSVRERIERVPSTTSPFSSKERSVQSRTAVSLTFSLTLPSVEARGRWRERGRMGRRT